MKDFSVLSHTIANSIDPNQMAPPSELGMNLHISIKHFSQLIVNMYIANRELDSSPMHQSLGASVSYEYISSLHTFISNSSTDGKI